VNPDPAAQAADDAVDRSQAARRIVLIGLFAFAVLQPAASVLGHPLDGRRWFEVIGSVVLCGLVCWRLTRQRPVGQPVPWLLLGVVLALGITLFALGGANWLGPLAVTAAVFGLSSQTPVPALIGATACGVAGLTVAVANGYQSGLIVAAALIAPMAGLLSYSASRRADAIDMLKRTRAELARVAVAEERLRIARDLHDLLGHSLSLITLKAELAGRVIGADPDRAAREIAELEAVARRSLADVREAVSGIRQPDLAGELTGARQLLDAAGITSAISSTGAAGLPQDIDGVLAWTVREGATNVVRHSKATSVSITVRAERDLATAEITDNGPAAVAAATPAAFAGPGQSTGPDARAAANQALPTFAGSGLAGLAERVRALGGVLAAGGVEPRGFRLRVVVPVRPPVSESLSDVGPAPRTIDA
jgi:two-component system, NarL family, sensor histidine kinase DesK